MKKMTNFFLQDESHREVRSNEFFELLPGEKNK